MTLSERQVVDAAMHVAAVAAAADGQLIEFYWRLFRRMAFPSSEGTSPPDLPEAELSERRFAFLAGAEAVFAFTMLASETCSDRQWNVTLDRMVAECRHINNELTLRYGNAAGSA